MSIGDGARISPRAEIGTNVTVGDFTVVGDSVRIGDDSVIESHCVIGYDTPLAGGRPLEIGAGAHIRTHCVFYAGSRFGPGLRTGHHVTAREGVEAGPGLQLGTLTDLQGDVLIGNHVRTHSNVHIGKHSKIGNYVWLFPYVVLTNDRQPPSEGPFVGPTIGDFAVVATMSVVMPGVQIGEHALVAAHALVRADVDALTVVGGVPARVLAQADEIMLAEHPGVPAYPWPRRFNRGYPADVVASWAAQWPPEAED